MKERIVITTNGTYTWSFVIQLLRNGWPSHGGDRKNFRSDDLPMGTLFNNNCNYI